MMTLHGLKHTLALVLLGVTFSAMGCATAGQRVDFMYEATGAAVGGSGEFYLAKDIQSPSRGEWELGDITGGDGKKLGDIVTGNAPADMIRDAYRQELEEAGYTVQLVTTLPQDVAKGMRIVGATVRLDEKRHLFKSEAACTLSLSLELWRNGRLMNRLRYVAADSESAFTGGRPLLRSALQKALHDVMTRSMPEIVETIEQHEGATPFPGRSAHI